MGLLRLACWGWMVALPACTVDPLVSAGRPCSADRPCGPEAVCDPVRGVCVAASRDRGPLAGDRAREAAVGLELASGDGPRVDAPAADARSDAPRVDLKRDTTRADTKAVDSLKPDTVKPDTSKACPGDCNALTNACNEGVCDPATGLCTTKPKVAGTPCSGGQCYGGSCCSGCWDGATCQGGNAAAACGDDGDLCQNCTSTECRSVAGSVCGYLWDPVCTTYSAKSNGTSCANGGGKCLEGACCTGCRDTNNRCRPGTYAGVCGAAGGACTNCLSECRTGSTCTNGVCTDPIKPDGTSCSNGNGKCLAGTCCTGCIASGLCYPGTSTSNCGDDGGTCKSCPAATQPCKKATCTSGSCGIGNATNGSTCSGGTCLSGSCCTGCVSAGTCVAGTSNTACGSAGAACTDCSAQSLTCAAGTCS